MATFTNKATLTYSGGAVNSNTVTGELLEVLAVTKNAVGGEYSAGDNITYVVSLRNSGTTTLSGLTVTDDLGAYIFNETTVYPLNYVDGSLNYYLNGVLQAAPTVSAGPPLSVSGLNIPAGGNALLVYETEVSGFAPLAADSTIDNIATVTGGGLSAPVTATAEVTAEAAPDLSISKALCPATVSENGQLTYTFVIENYGNTAAVGTDNITVTDIFSPILDPITVTLDGVTLTPDTDYTYDPATGLFTTAAGNITVPAATYTQNSDGTFTVTPGTATLVVTGTV